MITRLPDIEDHGAAKPQAPAAQGDTASAMLDSWLAMLVKLLRLPETDSRGIRDELEAHIRERVRDLLISGCDEHEAMRRAIAELGEAAGLAQSFRSARRSGTRRTVMHAAILGLAGGAALFGLVSVTQDQGGLSDSVFRPQPAAAVAELEQVKVDADFDKTPLSDVLAYLTKLTGRPSQVLWPRLEDAGVSADSPVSVKSKGAGVPAVLQLVSQSIGAEGSGQLELGIVEGILSVGPREFFDRRDTVMVSYDLSGVIAARMATYDEPRSNVVSDVVRVVTEFVSPDDWQDNGGDLAKLNVVGDRMFVRAPQRMHPQIKWIIGQLPVVASAEVKVPVLGDVSVVGQLFRGRQGLKPGEVKVFALKHAAAAEVVKSLEGRFPGYELKADPRTNSIIVARIADPASPEDAIGELDVPVMGGVRDGFAALARPLNQPK